MSKPNPFLKNSGTSRFALKDENKYKNKYKNNYENKTEDNAPVSSRWSNIKSDLDEEFQNEERINTFQRSSFRRDERGGRGGDESRNVRNRENMSGTMALPISAKAVPQGKYEVKRQSYFGNKSKKKKFVEKPKEFNLEDEKDDFPSLG